LETLFSTIGLDGLKSFLSDALQNEFGRTVAIFAAAAWVHSRQVRAEIKKQFGELVAVLKADLEGNKFLITQLGSRVNKIESKLGIEPAKES
jgi:predicted transcriptional regulator